MSAMTLERRPGRHDLAAFGLALGIAGAGVGAAVAAGLVAAGAGAWPAWLLPVAGATPAAAALRPASLAVPYDLWNRAARRIARLCRSAVIAVAFLVFTVVGRAGARLALRPGTGPSGWTPKAPAGGPKVPARQGHEGWARRVLAWGRGTGNRWSAVLLPYLALLEALEAERDVAGAEDIYTLY